MSRTKTFVFECPITGRFPVIFKCSGIYGIRHEATGRIYVGSAKEVRSRLYQHLNALLAGKHHSRYLQNAWRKYGLASFGVVLLEGGVAQKKLIEREQFWIDHLDSYEKGFNARPKAESMVGVQWSKSQNEARRQSNLKAWSNESLRRKLSTRFKGQHRGAWTADSHKKVSQTLKRRHAEKPEWRKKVRECLQRPENEAKRVAAVKAALKRPEVYNARVRQLCEARKSPTANAAIRKAYFEKFDRASLGFKNPKEMDMACLKLYTEGESCREISRRFRIDHHGVSARLKRLGVTLTRRRKRFSQ